MHPLNYILQTTRGLKIAESQTLMSKVVIKIGKVKDEKLSPAGQKTEEDSASQKMC